MTMRYSNVRVTIPNVVVPRTAAARDVIDAWWRAVEAMHIVDPNILGLSRDPEAFDIHDEDGEPVELEEGVNVFLAPLNKTSPEVMHIDVTWDGHDDKGFPIRLSIAPKVHREESRTRLLALWIEHSEVASHLFTDENEYHWKNHAGQETKPPWQLGQQVMFKLEPWTKDNTADRQSRRPRPPPADKQDPLGPFSYVAPAPRPTQIGGSDAGTAGSAPQTSDGTADQVGQYFSLTRPCSTKQISIRVEVEGRSLQVKVDPKILPQHLVHKVAIGLGVDLPGWWHASVIDGEGENRTYQAGDTVKLYPASTATLAAVQEPRTQKGSVAKIPKAIGGRPPKKREPKQKHDWIQMLRDRGEVQMCDAMQFSSQIDRNKGITLTTD
jgi:hypothetical protein